MLSDPSPDLHSSGLPVSVGVCWDNPARELTGWGCNLVMAPQRRITDVKGIYERNEELLERPAEERFLNDGLYRPLLNDLLAELFGPNAAVDPKYRHALLTDLFIVLRMAFVDAEDTLSASAKAQLRDLKLRIPIPADDELFVFYWNHYPHYNQLFQAAVQKWRRENLAANT